MRKKTKPKLIDLPERVSIYRREFKGGIVTVYNDDGTPITVERINWLLDAAKHDNMIEG